jgi:hypothetical protein
MTIGDVKKILCEKGCNYCGRRGSLNEKWRNAYGELFYLPRDNSKKCEKEYLLKTMIVARVNLLK